MPPLKDSHAAGTENDVCLHVYALAAGPRMRAHAASWVFGRPADRAAMVNG